MTLDPRDGGPVMFNSIARRYDLLNRVLSMGLDGGWRKRALERLELQPNQVLLDLCTGTGDFGLEALEKQDLRVIGLDVARDMMVVGQAKAQRHHVDHRFRFGVGDAENLPLANASIDRATIGFGIRNVTDRPKALRELARVLKPGGRVAILEFGVPSDTAFRSLYFFYATHLLPVIGGLLSGNREAYEYLPDSIRRFPSPEEFSRVAREAGFTKATSEPLALGIVNLYLFST
ncbi:MAG: ubiquinone biosynthesis methyltransferase UbiE [bacterium]|nr:MAG: ubiquinone biosynthesis methyltransferase UbiE [bacterium]